jgi:spermidine/putrescine transport system permease protein
VKQNKYGILYSLPLTVWLAIFFILPMLIVLVYAFLKKGLYGGVELEFTLRSFAIFKDRVFLIVLGRTILMSLLITFFTVVFAIPTAYFIARSEHRQEYLFLIIIPFWTNFLIRIYSWVAILGNNGLVNGLLIKSGIIKEPLQLLYNMAAVIVISVYTDLPFAILPLYAVIEKFDFTLMEAARDLGMTNGQAFFKVFLPNIKAGIITAVLFTFIPSLGSYAVPRLVGGTGSIMLGNLIAQHLLTTRNWPLASVISGGLIVVTGITIWLMLRLAKKARAIQEVQVSADE